VEAPLPTCTTKEKFQFITAYFNSSGHPETQNQSIDRPLNTILTEPNKKALVTTDIANLDFDIKMRFLTDDELAAIMGFPENYFKKPGLNLTKKQIIKMIGNAVHTKMAKVLIMAMMPHLEILNRNVA
jgi:site-specific DNA-cytosine methylase